MNIGSHDVALLLVRTQREKWSQVEVQAKAIQEDLYKWFDKTSRGANTKVSTPGAGFGSGLTQSRVCWQGKLLCSRTV